jgi:hypothetical protein
MKSLYPAILLIAFISFSLSASAQWTTSTALGANAIDIKSMGGADDIQAIKDRKLILMTLSEDSKVVNKFIKVDDTTGLKEYRAAIRKFNNDLITVVDLMWPYHDTHLLMPYDSIQKMDKLIKPQYVMIYFVRYDTYIEAGETKVHTSYDINWDGYLIGGNNLYSEKNKSDVDLYTVMKIAQVDEFRKAPPFQIAMPHISPTKTDIAFGMSYAVWYLNMKNDRLDEAQLKEAIDNNTKQLSTTTLLISSDDVKSKLVEDPYKAGYPYPFNVVPPEMLEQVIMSRMPGYAYLTMNCNKACITKAETGEPMFLFRPYDWNTDLPFSKAGKEISKVVGKTK